MSGIGKVVVTCGKLGCGKTTYAKRLCAERGAVLLSADEWMLSLFGSDAGEKHDAYLEKVKTCLLNQSLELVSRGVDAVLDWGLWTRAERSAIRAFYEARAVPCEIHCLEIDEETRQLRINIRNRAVLSGSAKDYYVDEGLAAKLDRLFEPPEPAEADVWVRPETEELNTASL